MSNITGKLLLRGD